MKTNIFILISFSILVGCKKIDKEVGKSSKIKFEVKNNSTKDCKIFLYYNNDSLYKMIEIKYLDSHIVDEGILGPAPYGPTYSLTNSLDSSIIEFSDGKKLTQKFYERGNNDEINNILSSIYYKNYEYLNPNFVRKQFVIYESDYLRAK